MPDPSEGMISYEFHMEVRSRFKDGTRVREFNSALCSRFGEEVTG